MRALFVTLTTVFLGLAACGDDSSTDEMDVEVLFPPNTCAGVLFDGQECDDGDGCTVADRCRDGFCVGEPRPREPFTCNGQDDDCDGITDEDCATELRLTGTIVGAGAATYDGLQQAIGTRTIVGTSANDDYRMEARP